MLTTLVASALISAQYKFDPGTKSRYDVEVVFDGFLPLLGGNTGKAEVVMGVEVQGKGPVEGGNLSASSSLSSFELKFNGGKLPLDLASAQVYFPTTTVSVTPTGKVVKTDAPDISLPVKLPGLDVKRFPEITYLPVELKEGDLKIGDKWTFTRLFGESPMNYTAELQAFNGSIATLKVSVDQSYEVLEDETLEIVKQEKDAVNRVKTTLTGSGTVLFDVATGRATSVDMRNRSVSEVTPIGGGSKSERKLDSTLKMRLKGATGTVIAPASGGGTQSAPTFWDRVRQSTQSVLSQGAGYVQMARLVLGMAAMYIPGLGPFIRTIIGS